MREAGRARRSTPALQLCRGDRCQWPHRSSAAMCRSPGAARSRCARVTASFELADHKDCATRGSEFRRFCGHRSGRQAINDRAFQGTLTPCQQRPLRRRAVSAMSKPGCSISTTRSIRITSISGSRWTSASAPTSPNFLKVSQGRSVPPAEGLLQALRHHHARNDDRARHESRRLSRLRAPDRPFAARRRIRHSAPRWRNFPAAS